MSETRTLKVNGSILSCQSGPESSLLLVLREELGLTGAKYGCGEGQCGACTVLIDGSPTRSCITPVRAVLNKEVTTIEGLERSGQLHPVQEAFLKEGAFQCGYCTPGMILSAVGLLRNNPAASQQEVLSSLQGNICRCGTYPRILAAIQKAASQMGGTG